MLVNFSIDLSCRSVAFVATLVLGVVLVMSPSVPLSAQVPAPLAVLQEEWLLPTVAWLLLGVRPGVRSRPRRRPAVHGR